MYKLPLVISDDKLRTPLIGRDLDVMVPMWRNQIMSQQTVLAIRQDLRSLSINIEIFTKFPNISTESQGPIKEFIVNINLKDKTVPVFHRPYSVPYALR